MKEQRLLQLLGEIDEQYITQSIPPEGSAQRRFRLPSWAACLCLCLLTAAVAFTTAVAVSADFRQAVRALLFPVYTEDTLQEIDQGHRTGSFDRSDTLFTFLEQFNREELESGVQVKKENGFAYTILSEGEDYTDLLVGCENPNQLLLVKMSLLPYEETTGLWQVTAYQILTPSEAEQLTNN